eukprot:196335_1
MSNLLKYLLFVVVIMSSVQARNIFNDTNLENTPEWRLIKNKVFTYFNVAGTTILQIYYLKLTSGLWHVQYTPTITQRNNFHIHSSGFYRYRDKNVFKYEGGAHDFCKHGIKRTAEIRILCHGTEESTLARIGPDLNNPCHYIGTFLTPLACHRPLPREVISTL